MMIIYFLFSGIASCSAVNNSMQFMVSNKTHHLSTDGVQILEPVPMLEFNITFVNVTTNSTNGLIFGGCGLCQQMIGFLDTLRNDTNSTSSAVKNDTKGHDLPWARWKRIVESINDFEVEDGTKPAPTTAFPKLTESSNMAERVADEITNEILLGNGLFSNLFLQDPLMMRFQDIRRKSVDHPSAFAYGNRPDDKHSLSLFDKNGNGDFGVHYEKTSSPDMQFFAMRNLNDDDALHHAKPHRANIQAFAVNKKNNYNDDNGFPFHDKPLRIGVQLPRRDNRDIQKKRIYVMRRFFHL
ncbi:uncharacterized protein LOC118190834 [Stegodyphus dumicola]|uniref:uncharacterized protein LOC118190834 n=1 Tax=Stegodyphus dumicola TaxID=202533 RepID=UPI0015B20164|nr:uncharacterized protein LOC118190834 [Stegodyphus dumicola]